MSAPHPFADPNPRWDMVLTHEPGYLEALAPEVVWRIGLELGALCIVLRLDRTARRGFSMSMHAAAEPYARQLLDLFTSSTAKGKPPEIVLVGDDEIRVDCPPAALPPAKPTR